LKNYFLFFFPATLYFVGKSRQFLFHVIFTFRVVLDPGDMFAIGRVKVGNANSFLIKLIEKILSFFSPATPR